MPYVTIYSYQVNPTTIRTVIRDTGNPTFIDFNDTYGMGAGSQPSEAATLAQSCAGTTLYRYHAKIASPYGQVEIIPNSPICGYTPPPCDITEKTFVVTDQTEIGINDGTVNLFATSSFTGIVYYLFNADLSVNLSNTTGYFTGLPPDTYTVRAQDSNGCSIVETATVQPYDSTKTHFKYRLQFTGANGFPQWELRLYDTKNNYNNALYPVDITGAEKAVVIKQGDSNEDKTTSIISKSLEINLNCDGDIITTDEFALAPERQWRVELYKDAELDFIGWLLPDETNGEYGDSPYDITLKATDGLPSLKGNIWGDGSGGNGYSTSQIQQYGLRSWGILVKQCLDQLGYNYGNPIVLNSLQFNGSYDANLWLKIATWSDILYSSDGNSTDTYSALDLLLSGLKMSIIQWRGRFVLYNNNDLYYATNGFKTDLYNKSFYEISGDFSSVINTGANVPHPTLQQVGFKSTIEPINPPQSLNYDKGYNIQLTAKYDILSLLYENPGFEQSASVGLLPLGFAYNGGTFEAGLINTDSLGGLWSFKVQTLAPPVPDVFIENTDAFPVDQVNKQVNISFSWKVPEYTSGGSIDVGWVFAYSMTYVDSVTGHVYFIKPIDFKAISLQDVGDGHSTNYNEIAAPVWAQTDYDYFTEGHLFSVKGSPIKDYEGWQDYNFTTPQLPESQIGQLFFRFYPAKLMPYDSSTLPTAGLSQQQKTHLYVETNSSTNGYYLIDNLNLTIGDYSQSSFTKYTGETHNITAITGIPQADLKKIDNKLFTYPQNKRVAGNIFYGTDYITGQVSNLWNYSLKTNDPKDRLGATIARSIARNYQSPLYLYEGDFSADYVDFYGVFTLIGLDGLFMPFSIEFDCVNSEGKIVLVRLEDDDQQAIYKYTPIFERNSRSNSN
jgi:hypothetical protein